MDGRRRPPWVGVGPTGQQPLRSKSTPVHKQTQARQRSAGSLPNVNKNSMLIIEANEIAQYLQKDYEFSLVEEEEAGGEEILLEVCVHQKTLGISCVWPLTKLKERLNKMRKLMYASEAEGQGMGCESVFFDPKDVWIKDADAALVEEAGAVNTEDVALVFKDIDSDLEDNHNKQDSSENRYNHIHHEAAHHNKQDRSESRYNHINHEVINHNKQDSEIRVYSPQNHNNHIRDTPSGATNKQQKHNSKSHNTKNRNYESSNLSDGSSSGSNKENASPPVRVTTPKNRVLTPINPIFMNGHSSMNNYHHPNFVSNDGSPQYWTNSSSKRRPKSTDTSVVTGGDSPMYSKYDEYDNRVVSNHRSVSFDEGPVGAGGQPKDTLSNEAALPSVSESVALEESKRLSHHSSQAPATPPSHATQPSPPSHTAPLGSTSSSELPADTEFLTLTSTSSSTAGAVMEQHGADGAFGGADRAFSGAGGAFSEEESAAVLPDKYFTSSAKGEESQRVTEDQQNRSNNSNSNHTTSNNSNSVISHATSHRNNQGIDTSHSTPDNVHQHAKQNNTPDKVHQQHTTPDNVQQHTPIIKSRPKVTSSPSGSHKSSLTRSSSKTKKSSSTREGSGVAFNLDLIHKPTPLKPTSIPKREGRGTQDRSPRAGREGGARGLQDRSPRAGREATRTKESQSTKPAGSSRARESQSSKQDSPVRVKESQSSKQDSPNRARESQSSKTDYGSNIKQDSPNRARESQSSKQDSPLRVKESHSSKQDSPFRAKESQSSKQDIPIRPKESQSTYQDSPVRNKESQSSKQDYATKEDYVSLSPQNSSQKYGVASSLSKALSGSTKRSAFKSPTRSKTDNTAVSSDSSPITAHNESAFPTAVGSSNNNKPISDNNTASIEISNKRTGDNIRNGAGSGMYSYRSSNTLDADSNTASTDNSSVVVRRKVVENTNVSTQTAELKSDLCHNCGDGRTVNRVDKETNTVCDSDDGGSGMSKSKSDASAGSSGSRRGITIMRMCRDMVKTLSYRCKGAPRDEGLVDRILYNCEVVKVAVINILDAYTQAQHDRQQIAVFADSELIKLTSMQLVGALELLVSHTSLWVTSFVDIDSGMVRGMCGDIHRLVQQLSKEMGTFLQACETDHDAAAADSATTLIDLLYSLVKQCGELSLATESVPGVLMDRRTAGLGELTARRHTDDLLNMKPSCDMRQWFAYGSDVWTDRHLQSSVATLVQCERQAQMLSEDCYASQCSEEVGKQIYKTVGLAKSLAVRCQRVQEELSRVMRSDAHKPESYFYHYMVRNRGVLAHMGTLADSVTLLGQVAEPLTEDEDPGALRKVTRCTEMIYRSVVRLSSASSTDNQQTPRNIPPSPDSLLSPTPSSRSTISGLSLETRTDSFSGLSVVLSEAQCERIEAGCEALTLACHALTALARRRLPPDLAASGGSSSGGKVKRMLPATPGGGSIPGGRTPILRCKSAKYPDSRSDKVRRSRSYYDVGISEEM